MENLYIVAVSGKICSGKTTLARNLAKYGLERYPLAGPLKRDIAQLCDVSEDYINENKSIFRQMLQIYGTDVMRVIKGEDYWVNRLCDVLNARCVMNSDCIAIVDDVRYPNEVEGLKSIADKFVAIRLLVSPETQAFRYEQLYGEPLSEEKRLHISETALDTYYGFDMVVTGELEDWLIENIVTDGLRAHGILET